MKENSREKKTEKETHNNMYNEIVIDFALPLLLLPPKLGLWRMRLCRAWPGGWPAPGLGGGPEGGPRPGGGPRPLFLGGPRPGP